MNIVDKTTITQSKLVALADVHLRNAAGRMIIPILVMLLLPVPPTPAFRYHLLMPAIHKANSPKKGVGLSYAHCEDVTGVDATWQYGWSAHPRDCASEDVPMIWGDQQIGDTIGGDSQWLLGFNEPDRPEQANLTPWEAAELWRTLDAEHADLLLVSPAPSHLDPAWLARFRQAYIVRYGHAPRLDALAVHCYGGYAGCRRVVEQVIGYASAWGIEGGVWVTEFATPPCLFASEAEALEQARALIQWMNTEPGVMRYAWFTTRISGEEWWGSDMDCATPLLDFNAGTLTEWGQMYRRQ